MDIEEPPKDLDWWSEPAKVVAGDNNLKGGIIPNHTQRNPLTRHSESPTLMRDQKKKRRRLLLHLLLMTDGSKMPDEATEYVGA
jgi:hypothetical protein